MRNIVQMVSVGVLLAIGAIYGLAGITIVDPGEVGIIVKMIGSERGMQSETLDTGARWVDPFRYDVIVYDTKSRQHYDGLSDMPSQTKDGQPILVDISLELMLIDENVPLLHEHIGKNYYSQVVYPTLRSAVRNTTTTQLSDEIYTGKGRSHVQQSLQSIMDEKLEPNGIKAVVNLRDVEFTNTDFVATLEQKAKAAQKVVIEERNAEAAQQTAIKMANLAEGEKQKRIKAAEADREERRLKGEGDRLEKEEAAKGNLALYRAEAEGTRLQVRAYGGGDTYASVKWAENMGPNIKVYGFPTGSPGTSSIMDLNGLMSGAFSGVLPKK